jgi:ribosomal protein S27AE
MIGLAARLRYQFHRLQHTLHLPAYRRRCPACGARAFSWVHTRDGRSVCAECHRKEQTP